MGGTDDRDNLIALPSRAHFIAHALLHKAYPDNTSLAHAFAMMAVNNKSQNRTYSSRLYEMSKVARSNALKGKPRPEWVKEKLRVPKKSKDNYKGAKSEDHKKNISNGLKGKKKSMTHIQNMVNSQKESQQKRHKDTMLKIEKYRQLFIESKLSRKDFYKLHNLNPNTGKGYLRGL